MGKNKRQPKTRRIPINSGARNRARWESLRLKDPVLQLVPMRDDLEWLFAGEPDPDASLDFFVLCAVSDPTNLREIGSHLVEFQHLHPTAFLHSGWVREFVGRIVLGDKETAHQLLGAFWKQSRSTKSRKHSYRALRRVQGEHRGHWLYAASWMQNFRLEKHSATEKDLRFVRRAIEAYSSDTKNKPCGCLVRRSLNKIAETVLDHPDQSPSVVVDYALVKAFKTSHGTLTHLRAEINKRH